MSKVAGSTSYSRWKRYNTSGALGMWGMWLPLGRRFLGVVSMSGITKCTFGRHGSCRVMFVVTVGHAESVSHARDFCRLLEEETTPASTVHVWLM